MFFQKYVCVCIYMQQQISPYITMLIVKQHSKINHHICVSVQLHQDRQHDISQISESTFDRHRLQIVSFLAESGCCEVEIVSWKQEADTFTKSLC